MITVIKQHVTFENFFRYLKYMISGVPAFGFAVLFNLLLVGHWHVPVLIAYAFVLIFQMFMNFFICHYLIFKSDGKPTAKRFGHFSFFTLFFQGVSWLTYALMVKQLHIYYILAQLINIAGLSIFKFLWASKIFTNKK